MQEMQEMWFAPWVRKIPWRRKWQPTPVSLPGESHGQRSLVDYSPWGCKESKMTDQLSTHTRALLLNEFQTVFRGCFMIIHVICHCTFLCISTTWGYKEFWSIQIFMLRNRILKKTGVVDHDLSRPFATVHRPPLTQSWKICNLVLPWWLRG